jgi:hypothetical protein
MIKDLKMDENGEYLMSIDSKEMMFINRMGESISKIRLSYIQYNKTKFIKKVNA